MANKNPYVGLRPFDTDESLLFFGRDNQTLELLQRLHEHSFVAVVGSSGSGKSSLLRAGLIPALNGGFLVNNSDVWKVAIMKPGQDPLFNLAEEILKALYGQANREDILELLNKIHSQGALAIIDRVLPLWKEGHFNFFLLVDQFEEIFRFSMNQNDSAKRDAAIDFVDIFLELTTQKVVPFFVVLTMRSDFIGDCAQFHGLPEAMNKSQYLVPRLTREQLKKVIEGPAQLFGGRFNSALTSILLNHIGKVRDELPVLQHALMRMWDYETHVDKNQSLDLTDYHNIGGIEKALSNHADEALQEKSLSKEDRKVAKKLFKALTSIDDHGRKIRRPALLSELTALTNVPAKRLLEIIDHFVRDDRSFLFVHKIGDTEEKLIDISHESLIRQWQTLEKWVEQENENAKIYLKLLDTLREYQAGEKLLLDDLELQKFVEWRDRFKPTESWAIRYGNAASFKAGMEYIESSEKKQRKKRIKRRLLIAGSMVLALGAVIIFMSRNARERNKDYAERLHDNAQQHLEKNPTMALQLEMAAYNVQKNKVYKDSALAIYHGDNSFYKINTQEEDYNIARPNDKLLQELISPSYNRILAKFSSGVLNLFDMQGKSLKSISTGKVNCMVFSEDGSKFAIGKENGQIEVWNSESVESIWNISNPKDTLGITSLAFSKDNQRLITGNEEGNVTMWDVNGTALFEKDLTSATEYSVTILKFSPDDSRIFGSSFLNSVIFNENEKMDLTTGKYDESGLLNAAAFHPELPLLATGGKDQMVRIWNLEEETSKAFPGHKAEVNFVDFLIDEGDTFVVSASLDNVIFLWNLSGEVLQEFVGHEDKVISIEMSKDGTAILSRSLDLSQREWPLNSYALQKLFESGRSQDSLKLMQMIQNSPPDLPLEKFLESGKIESLSHILKNEYGIK